MDEIDEWVIADLMSKYKHSILGRRLKNLKEYGFEIKIYVEEEFDCYTIILDVEKDDKTFTETIYELAEEDRDNYMEYITSDLYDYIKVNKLIRDIIKAIGNIKEEIAF